MAVIDDLVSSGLSGTQATEVVAVGAGTGSESALVSQGFSVTQASVIMAGGDEVALVQQGLFGTQATAVVAAIGGGGGGGGGAATYTAGIDYTDSPIGTYVQNYGTLRIYVRSDRWTNTTGFNNTIAAASGASITITTSGNAPYTTTLASGFVQDGMLPEQWYADVTPNSGMFPFPTGNVDTFTIG